jgi:hypothetical protein
VIQAARYNTGPPFVLFQVCVVSRAGSYIRPAPANHDLCKDSRVSCCRPQSGGLFGRIQGRLESCSAWHAYPVEGDDKDMVDEERPLQEARSGLIPSSEENPPLMRGEEAINDNSVPRSGMPPIVMIAGIIVVVGLFIAALFLPPFSIAERLSNRGSDPAVVEQVAEVVPPGNVLAVGTASLALSKPAQAVQIGNLAQVDFATATEWATAAAAIPTHLVPKGDIYTVSYSGDRPEGSVTLALDAGIPENEVATLDLYGWFGSTWRFIPSQPDGQQLVSADAALPHAFALMQTTHVGEPAVGAELLPTQAVPVAVLPLLTEVIAGTLSLAPDGQLLGEVVTVPTGGYRQLVRVTNTGAVVDQATLAAFLADLDAQGRQIENVVNVTVEGGFAGVNVDYQGVAAGQRNAFTGYLTRLAEALHARDLLLVVSVETPTSVAGRWNSTGQDWAAIGAVADAIYLQMPLAPDAYDDNGPAEQLLRWAVRQVDRYKLTAMVSAGAVDALDDFYAELTNEQALANFGELHFIEGGDEVEPETLLEVGLSGTASPIEWDMDALAYKYSYEQNGQTRQVWLGNEAAFSYRLRLGSRYHLRGVAVRGLGAVDEAEGYATGLQSYLGTAAAPQPAGAAIVWTVTDETGSVIASDTGESLNYSWQAPADTGTYLINAAFAQGQSTAKLGTLRLAVMAPPEPEPEPEPVVEEETPAPPVAAPQPAATPVPVTAGSGDAAANTVANIRKGPGLHYGTIGSLQRGQQVSLTGRNGDNSWLQIAMSGDEKGWVFATLLTLNPSINVNSLALIEVDPPAGGGGGGGAPPPVIPPATGGGFVLGGQTHSLGNPGLMRDIGMTWVKFQHKWGPGDNPDAVAGRIQQAHANGFKVLLSIPGHPYPSSIDFAGYVDFLGGVAAYGPDAIEIWNEQNIDFEWPAGQINAATYVNQMLAPAYNRIKSVNSNVMVISGAPAPTGFFGGGCSANGCDDSAYLAGMAAAGAARYMDCVGVHYNEGIISPNQESGDPRGGHYTRYYWGMVNLYWNAFGGSRPLCFTELGYLSGQDFGGVPSRFGWAGNTTVAQHAQWLAEATSISANSGKVRMLIIFNVDFTLYSEDPQAGYAMIRPDGSCPSCPLLKQVMGR